MTHAVVEASHACGGAAVDLMEVCAVDPGGGGGRGESVGSMVGFVGAADGRCEGRLGAEGCRAACAIRGEW